MNISSSAFKHNDYIPKKYTCDGYDINPPLEFHDIPEEAKSLVLIVDDPDAPNGTWVHWTMWNINPHRTHISHNSLPHEVSLGITSFGSRGYGGPCPPSGIHHYHFKLYALDTKLDLPDDTQANELEEAMNEHILEQATLVGLYKR